MDWERRIIYRELSAYLQTNIEQASLSEIAQALIRQQQASWLMLREASAAFNQVEYRYFDIKGSRVIAQNNPKRIVSTAAKVDTATISQRPCFLCPDNLPPEEKGIAFGQDYVMLCNPFPVLKNHLVLSHRLHTPQTIIGRFQALTDFTQRLGNEWFTLYNGPKCGASAPDHLHFQACDRSMIPLFAELDSFARQTLIAEPELRVFSLKNYRLHLVVARSRSQQKLRQWFERYVESQPKELKSDAEPMLNLVATADGEEITVVVFPRAKHRPACYFAEGEAKLTISPAGIDLAGVLVIPERSHFEKVTADDIENIYAEITRWSVA
jgi:ATP adenylyltransferase/5',5'''-P-1,P-4-tetraphosphate phosphorylase II